MAADSIKNLNIKLMIVGEFYEPAQPYLDLIHELGIQDRVILNS